MSYCQKKTNGGQKKIDISLTVIIIIIKLACPVLKGQKLFIVMTILIKSIQRQACHFYNSDKGYILYCFS